MKRMFINLLVYLLISSYQLKSQTLYSVDKWMEYIEEMASETEDEERIEALYTDLSYLVEHPFELNTVTEGELKRLPFLSDLQIRELLGYRSRYGKMLTLYDIHSKKVLPHLFLQPDRTGYVHRMRTNNEQNGRTALLNTSDSDIVVAYCQDMNDSLSFVENIYHI